MGSKGARFDGHGHPIKVDFPVNKLYESVEFNVANGISDYDVKASESAFVKLPSWTSVVIRTNKNISVKLNATTNQAITINEYESPFHLTADIEIENIYITNASGAQVAIKLLAFNRTIDDE